MENWKYVPGYEGVYKVSDLGNVYSLQRISGFRNTNRMVWGGSLAPGINSNGYEVVVLSKEGKRSLYGVHQLVAMAFLDHTPCGLDLVVDHINEIKTDNRLINLQLITQKENITKSCIHRKKKNINKIYTK